MIFDISVTQAPNVFVSEREKYTNTSEQSHCMHRYDLKHYKTAAAEIMFGF